MIVKPTKEEAKLLDRCLSYVAEHVDEICITQAGEQPIKEVSDVIKKYKGKESFFKWVYDFAKARNYNFSQTTGDYIFWCDSDDVVRGSELLRGLAEKMNNDHIDASVMNYLYDFKDGKCTVKHLKTRMVKKGTVEWVGEIHEDFRNIIEPEAQFTDEIEILHITDEERAIEASKRNVDIAKRFMKSHPDDARGEWLVANALMGEGETGEAMKYFHKFLKITGSIEEKFIALMRMGDISKDESYYLKAMALRPSYPDAYLKLGELNYYTGKFDQAEGFLLQGLKLKVPDRQIIVYNPRDYDFNPLVILANTYFAQAKYPNALKVLETCKKIYPDDPKIKTFETVLSVNTKMEKEVDEFLKKATRTKNKEKLKKMCDEFKHQSHPKFCVFKNMHFVKTETSGKDLVYYCSYTDDIWHPKSGKLGGSEEAVINLSEQWAQKGWNVTVYNNCGLGKKYGNVNYKPYWEFNIKDKQDVIVIWRHAKPLDFNLNAETILVDMHDVFPKAEFTPERIKKLTKVMVKTKAHRKLFPNIPDNKICVVPNGFDPEPFQQEVKRNPYLILNTSSPERSLDATIDIFEELIKKSKKPWKLAWYYGWHNYEKWHKDNPQMMAYMKTQVKRFESLKKRGLAEGGYMIPQSEIAKKYLEASYFLYPTQFFEIHCISSIKAQYAGCKMVTSDFAALKESVQFGTKIHTEGKKWSDGEINFGDTQPSKYVDAILEDKKVSAAQSQWALDTYNWNNISSQWLSVI